MLCSGMDEGENHERGVGFILSKEAAQCLLEWNNQSQVQLKVAAGHHLSMLCPNK